MLEPLRPRSYGREYYELKGGYQYPMFLATALGVKPSFDDWIDINHYDRFVEMCQQYHLAVEPDVIFRTASADKDKIVGGHSITTTFQYGTPFNRKATQGKVHVFVGQTKEITREAKRFGWYSVVINQRITNKPFIDHLRFGKCLGYPECCIDFFRRYNNWAVYSHPYETYKNTFWPEEATIGSYLCNNFLMDQSFFFIHHLPCSYRCPSTMKLAARVEKVIHEVEPEYADRTRTLLKKPLLVFAEKNFILFDGELTREGGNEILRYKDCEYISNMARPEDSIPFFDSVKSGNTIIRNRDTITVLEDSTSLKVVSKRPEWFMIDFG